jgi:hypothetical protein
VIQNDILSMENDFDIDFEFLDNFEKDYLN